MKVRELIENLQEYDPDLTLLLHLEEDIDEQKIMDIESFMVVEAETQRINQWGKPDVIGKVKFNFIKSGNSRKFLFINVVTQF